MAEYSRSRPRSMDLLVDRVVVAFPGDKEDKEFMDAFNANILLFLAHCVYAFEVRDSASWRPCSGDCEFLSSYGIVWVGIDESCGKQTC